jgi:hypothetical protein
MAKRTNRALKSRQKINQSHTILTVFVREKRITSNTNFCSLETLYQSFFENKTKIETICSQKLEMRLKVNYFD